MGSAILVVMKPKRNRCDEKKKNYENQYFLVYGHISI